MFTEEDRSFMLYLVRELAAALRTQPKQLEKRLLSVEELTTYMATRPQTIRNHLSRETWPIPARKLPGVGLCFDKKLIDSYIDRVFKRTRLGSNGPPLDHPDMRYYAL